MEKWLISNGLLYKDSYSCDSLITSFKDIVSIRNQNPSEIKFKVSKIVSEVALRADLVKDHIVMSLECFRHGEWIPISNSHIVMCDYFIFEDVAIPVNIGPLNSINLDLYKQMSLSQYARIVGYIAKEQYTIFHDHVRSSLGSHPIVPIGNADQLKIKLYPYQEVGVGWLEFITELHGGCILGDEMGLGKTPQIIALINKRLQIQNFPSLIIVPASLLDNWKREFEKFTDGINVCIHHGARRTGNYAVLKSFQVVITSYNVAVSDLSVFSMITWDVVILDEAQNIKNKNSIRSKTVKMLDRCSSIAVTGTPFENHLSDLWSIVDFILPGYLGSSIEFENNYSEDGDGASKLEPVISPIMLRRHVSDVAKDLPPRVDIPLIVTMGDSESEGYEELRQQILQQHHAEHITGFMIQKLRMYCTHPGLINNNFQSESEKFNLLKELLSEICDLGEKTIVFTSFNKMFIIIEKYIRDILKIPVFIINGSVEVSIRQSIIDDFSNVGGPAIIILNPRAAGVGLNITAASRVIHYNLEWNPALEDQASARAYRRGQCRTVFVYRLYYKDTAEEVINERLERKRDLFDKVIKGTDGVSIDQADLIRAISMTPRRY